MPVVGVLDPAHDERKALRSGRLPKWLSLDEIREEARVADPKWSPWSYELVTAALGEIEERGTNISTTALTSPCPRSVVLERKESYVVTLDELWRAFRGTMVHYVLEDSAREGSIAEVRFFAPIYGDEMISCKPDLVTADGTIWDYKNTAEVPRYNYPYTGHTEQLQFNRFIIEHSVRWEKDDKPVDLPFDPRHMEWSHLAVMYMDLDGPKPLEVLAPVQIPKKDGSGTYTRRKPDIWDDEKVLWGWKDYEGVDVAGLVERYKAMRNALDMYPDWPSGLEEVWGGEAGWACPGYPHCPLQSKCLASRYPAGLIWERE